MTARSGSDLGLFGPSSVTWRVHGDPSMALGGIRALLLQAVHPLAMAGVAQHSGFRDDPWGRLLRTGQYVATVTFGTTAEAERAGARVRGMHSKLAGIEPESGEAYRATSPKLLTWVHLCEVDSFLSTALRSGLRLSRAEQDRYCDEQRRAAALVGLDPATVPGSVDEVAAWFDAMRPRLRVTAAARDAAAFVLWPPMPALVQLGTPARPAWTALASAAFALLPRWARRLYRLPGLPTTDLAATASARLLRAGLLTVPEPLRTSPERKAALSRAARAESA